MEFIYNLVLWWVSGAICMYIALTGFSEEGSRKIKLIKDYKLKIISLTFLGPILWLILFYVAYKGYKEYDN